jgi:sulfate transport system permease protein
MPGAGRGRRTSPLPGLGLSLGITILWLSFIVLIPLSAVFVKSLSEGGHTFWAAAASPRALAAYRLSFGAAALGAAINCVFGLLVAWVLVRYSFPGRRLLGALIDLPHPRARGLPRRVQACRRRGRPHLHRTSVRRAHR